MSIEHPQSYPDKPGSTRPASDADHVWLQGLLRYTRNAELATPSRLPVGTTANGQFRTADLLPNQVTLFAGFSSRFLPGRLMFLFRSFLHTDHSQYIAESTRLYEDKSLRHTGNVALKLADSGSVDIALQIEGAASVVPVHSAEEHIALNALRQARRLKGLPDVALDPTNSEDERQAMYTVKPINIFTQGERFSVSGNHVGEGHPPLQEQLLVGFEQLPALPPGMRPPASRQELFVFLRAQGYQHPALS